MIVLALVIVLFMAMGMVVVLVMGRVSAVEIATAMRMGDVSESVRSLRGVESLWWKLPLETGNSSRSTGYAESERGQAKSKPPLKVRKATMPSRWGLSPVVGAQVAQADLGTSRRRPSSLVEMYHHH